MELTPQTPFQDESLERAILGAAIIDADSFNLISGTTISDHFWHPLHRFYWQAVVQVRATGNEPSVLTVRVELGSRATVDTATHLSGICDEAESVFTVEQCAGKLLDLYKSRTLYYRLTALIQCAPATDPQEWMEMVSLVMNGIDVQPGRRIEAVWDVAMRLVRDADKKESSGVTRSGFEPFDDATGGLTNGMTIIAGRPSMGKSALAHQVMLAVAKKRMGAVMYCSIETSNEETVKRMVVGEADVDYAAAFRNRLSANESDKYLATLEEFSGYPLYMLDIASLTPSRIRAEAVKLQQSEGGLALVVVDYIQSVKPDRVGRDVRGDVTSVATALRDLARDLNVPVIAVAQLNRESELKKRRPCMADLGESGALEQAASAVVFPFRPVKFGLVDENNKPFADNYAEIIVGKNRNGTDGCVKLRWNGSRVRFES